jgi:uncharacterized protein (TIGR02646 family)
MRASYGSFVRSTISHASVNVSPLPAKRLWKPDNKTFDEVINQLIDMCPGTRRCCYCEDARGEDIEHFRPKKFYPDVAFQWDNYLYACSACNSNAKRDRFAVFDAGGSRQDLIRAKNVLAVPPLAGDSVLINPRYEDPQYFLRIEFNTFQFLPRRGLNQRDEERARYTIEILQLNTRSELVQWRTDSFRLFIGWMDSYRRYKQEEASLANH